MIDEMNICNPALRFSEFLGDDWRIKELSSIATPVTKRANSNSTYKVLTLSSENGVVSQNEYFGKRIAGSNFERYINIQKDDFVYNDRTTSLYPYGAIKRNNLDVNGIVSPIYKCFKFIKEQYPIFWEYYFESHCHEPELKKFINEGARVGRFNLSLKQFLQICVALPSWREQQKIADCLSSLDELIQAHQQKRDSLVEHKKGLMQRLFPAEGETTPRWRFPEFRKVGEWKKYKVGDLFTATRGEVLAMSKVQESRTDACPYPVYSSQTKNNGLAGFYSTYLYEDAITWTTDGANAGDVNYREGKFFCTNVCGVLLSKDGYCNKCVAEIINSISRKHVSYVGNPKLMNNVMKEIEIYIPSIAEQQKIADCLSSLDARIEAEEDKLASLREHKQGLMQQLFPQSL